MSFATRQEEEPAVRIIGQLTVLPARDIVINLASTD